MSDGLSDLTVLIPTWNRERYVRRQIEFWAGSEATVIIADGSPDPIHGLAVYPSIQYRHHPIPLPARLRLLGELVETPWGVLLSDDEFMLPSALAACIRKLEADSSVVSCKPFPVGFDVSPAGVRWSVPYPELMRASLGGGPGAQRVREHLHPYRMLSLWSVTRADVLRNACGAIGDLGPVRCSGAQEILYSSLVAAAGRALILDRVGWLRSYENENVWGANDRLPLDKWLEEPLYAEEVSRFREVFSARVCDLAIGDFDEAVQRYAGSLSSARLATGEGWTRTFARVSQALSRRMSRTGSPAWSVQEVARTLRKQGITCDLHELAAIEARLMDFIRS